MNEGVQFFSGQEELDLSPQETERGALGLRAMISQLANHRKRDREIPRRWRSAFETLVARIADTSSEMLVALRADTSSEMLVAPLADTSSEMLDCQILSVRLHTEIDAESVASSEEEPNTSELFHSDDPQLHRLLQPCRRRLSSKCTAPLGFPSCRGPVSEPSAPVSTLAVSEPLAEPGQTPLPSAPVSTLAVSELELLAEPGQTLLPSDFATMNKAKKLEAAEKVARSGARGSKLKQQPPKSGPPTDDKRDVRRKSTPQKLLHSRVWHAEQKRCLALGLSKAEAKLSASTLAKAKVAEFFASLKA